MSNEAIRPSTMDGIKRLAQSFRVSKGIQHSQALNEAAKAAGFQNFQHARKAIPGAIKPESLQCVHRVFLTVYWKELNTGSHGRETLAIWLSVPWGDLITLSQLRIHRALMQFRPEGSDHLAVRKLEDSQSDARRVLCAAARVLHFMDATKLRPSNSHSRAYPGGHFGNAIPGRDHSCVWYDRDTKRYLFSDEPYEDAARSKAVERASWAQRHGFLIVEPAWKGMYNPDGGTQLFLIADAEKGVPLEPIISALNKLPPAIVEATWDGESAPTLPIFCSPGAFTRSEKPKKTEVPRKAAGPRSTVGYVRTLVGPQRRPKSKMPIEMHEEVGRLLKSVRVATSYRKGVCNRIDAVRAELDEWAQREYTRAELSSEQFAKLYYKENEGFESMASRSLSASERVRHASGLATAKTLLGKHYPECPPLRSLMRKLDAAIKSLQSWSV